MRRLRPTIMRFRLLLLAVALVATACGNEGALSSGSTSPTVGSASPATTTPAATVDRIEPGPQQASRTPEPVSEPILTPVPAPAPEPIKPARPGLPAPPPPRSAPVDPQPLRPSDDAVTTAIVDLAARLGVGVDEVGLLDARHVTWRDGSIGCPEPALAYTQAEVPGALIVLRVADSSYRYHAAEDAPFFYCGNPQAPLEGGA